MSDDSIVLEVTYPHPIERVWRVLTDSDALAEWLMPNDFAPRVGHQFTFRRRADGGWAGTVQCEVVVVEPPRRLEYTWQGGNLPTTLVAFHLTSVAEGTRLRLEHSGFAAGGGPGLTIRDILASGWNSKIMRERLPALLDRIAAEDVTSSHA